MMGENEERLHKFEPGLSLWDNLCIHAAYHNWNPISLILRDDWVFEVLLQNGLEYPGWRWR